MISYRFEYDDGTIAKVSGHMNFADIDIEEWLAVSETSGIVQTLVVPNNELNEIKLPAGMISGAARQYKNGKDVNPDNPGGMFSFTFDTDEIIILACADTAGDPRITIGMNKLFPGSFDLPRKC